LCLKAIAKQIHHFTRDEFQTKLSSDMKQVSTHSHIKLRRTHTIICVSNSWNTFIQELIVFLSHRRLLTDQILSYLIDDTILSLFFFANYHETTDLSVHFVSQMCTQLRVRLIVHAVDIRETLVVNFINILLFSV
jgi:hypothetical protein